MNTTKFGVLAFALLVPACGGADAEADPANTPGFGETAVPAGYIRFHTEPITLQPGESGLWAQWVAAPFERDVDVLDITGDQEGGGHHALMYSSLTDSPVGYTRLWQDLDQLTTRFVGGIGGEGGANVTLPAGVVFRIPQGQGLMVQTHYINTTSEPIVGQTYLDVLIEDANPSRKVAAIFSNTNTAVNVPAQQESTMQASCELREDVQLLMFANHLHEVGKNVVTELIEGDHATDIKRDDAWDYEWQSNPNFTKLDPESPLVLKLIVPIRLTGV